MSRYFYFKSRPGVIWAFNRKTGRWIRNLVFRQDIFEPDCITLRGMNEIGNVNDGKR